jgi:hypothetical protein
MSAKTEFRCLRCDKGRKEIELRRDPVTDAYFCRDECWDARPPYTGTPVAVDVRWLSDSKRHRRQVEETVHHVATQWPESVRRRLTHPEARQAVESHNPTTCRPCQEGNA